MSVQQDLANLEEEVDKLKIAVEKQGKRIDTLDALRNDDMLAGAYIRQANMLCANFTRKGRRRH